MDQFQAFSDWIIQQDKAQGDLNGALGFLDFYDDSCLTLADLKPLDTNRQPHLALAALLMLAHPEIHWVLNTPYSDGVLASPEGRNYHILGVRAVDDFIHHQCEGFSALFDPTGLREMLRRAIWVSSFGDVVPFPERQELAVALDDEKPFAYFNALAAYRAGLRVWVLPTWRIMESVLQGTGYRTFGLIFEDLYLNFPDRPDLSDLPPALRERTAKLTDDCPRVFSCLEFRDAMFPALAMAGRRVIVTGGCQKGDEAQIIADHNRKTHYSPAGSEPKARVIQKPVAGLFRLLRDAAWWDDEENRPQRPKGFSWPPNWTLLDRQPSPTRTAKLGLLNSSKAGESEPIPVRIGHSAPGRALLVAERLMERSRMLLSEDALSVPNAVRAAMLALEAKELLSGRTPTAALEALSLQHEAEVAAESLFVGVQSDIDPADRFRDIEVEVDAMVSWLGLSQRRAAINAKLVLVERLAQRFRALGQVEEELACLAVARGFQAEFARGEGHLWDSLIRFVGKWNCGGEGRKKPSVHSFLLLRYVAECLSSFTRFLLAVTAWMVIFGVLHGFVCGGWLQPSSDWSWHGALTQFFVSVVSFVTVNPAGDLNSAGLPALILWAVQGGVAFFHWGLLLSHAYLYVSRR